MIGSMHWEDVRTVLIITLSILVVAMAYRRFRQYVQRVHAPVPQHVELVGLEVTYHPSVLRVQVSMPNAGQVFPAMLSACHDPMHSWPPVQMAKGDHILELALEPGLEGPYFLEIATDTQRTERRFIVRS